MSDEWRGGRGIRRCAVCRPRHSSLVTRHSSLGRAAPALWRQPDFLRLWTGQTVSLFGSQITLYALPLLATLTLEATPAQLSLLLAAGRAPDLLVSLVAGVWVDRLRRRPLLIAADLGRAALLLAIPLAALLGALRLPLLVGVAFLLGLLGTIFGIAYQSFLPALVPKDRLVEGNSRLEASSALANVAGPGLAGALVQALTAPVAVVVDALSFLVSALSLGRIRAGERPPPAGERRAGVWREARAGLGLVAREPVLRALTGAAATFNFFDSFLFAIYIIYLTRVLGFSAAAVGAVFAVGGAGGLLGTAVAGGCARRFGIGRALIGAILLAGLGDLGIALAAGPPAAALAVVAGAEALVQGTAVVFGVNGTSLRQAVTPDRLLGRVNATARLLRGGVVPLGALLGGLVAERAGVRPTVLLAGCGTLLAVLWVLGSPVRRMQRV